VPGDLREGLRVTLRLYLCLGILHRMDHGKKNALKDRILLEGMIFHGNHGTLPAERELGQPFVVDVELYLDLQPAGLSDDLAQTVDYSDVHLRAKSIVEGPPVNLTEAVAERIALAILEDHPLVEAVRVKVAKPHVRLHDTVFAGSAVEILRDRGAS
jgi:7,8-dihydroneopterin aldolase/epimerase/oxygenase